VKNFPAISTGSRVALPSCRKGMIVGIDYGRGDRTVWFRVLPDGSAEEIKAEAFMAVPILGAIGTRGGQ